VEGGKNPDDSRLAEAVTAAALGTHHQQTKESKSSRAIGAYAQIITARVEMALVVVDALDGE
jgi:hypothetical protein